MFQNPATDRGAATAPSSLLELGQEPPRDWQERGLCAQTDPEAFFPEHGASTKDAKKVCALCEVRTECLAYALERREAGVWGGLTERERRHFRAEQRGR